MSTTNDILGSHLSWSSKPSKLKKVKFPTQHSPADLAFVQKQLRCKTLARNGSWQAFIKLPTELLLQIAGLCDEVTYLSLSISWNRFYRELDTSHVDAKHWSTLKALIRYRELEQCEQEKVQAQMEGVKCSRCPYHHRKEVDVTNSFGPCIAMLERVQLLRDTKLCRVCRGRHYVEEFDCCAGGEYRHMPVCSWSAKGMPSCTGAGLADAPYSLVEAEKVMCDSGGPCCAFHGHGRMRRLRDGLRTLPPRTWYTNDPTTRDDIKRYEEVERCRAAALKPKGASA